MCKKQFHASHHKHEQTVTFCVAGISAVDMCLSNCTWSGDKTIDLYPWDAGTDDGITYMVGAELSVLSAAVPVHLFVTTARTISGAF